MRSVAAQPEQLADINGRPGSLKLLLIGDGRGDLEGVRDEFHAIVTSLSPLQRQGYLHVSFLLGANLTVDNVRGRIDATRYHIVHYAGHTFDQGLVLPFADGDTDVGDFIAIISRNPPTLLVVDACSALGSPEDLDLATPWCVRSGAIMVVGTSALVQDDAPAKVFPRFYTSLVRGAPLGVALQEAGILALVNEGPNAGVRGLVAQCFVLGDPSLVLH